MIDEAVLTCIGCQEDWPHDAEFYRPGSVVCLACEADGIKNPRKPKTRGFRTSEQQRQYQREKYLRHREAYMARMRRWYAANRESQNEKRRAKYAAKKQAALAAQEV